MKKLAIVTLALIVLLPVAGRAQSDKDKEGVRQAVLDYVEGIYEVDHTRIERSVHPELVKRGFFIKKGETAYTGTPMTYDQLVNLAKNWNKDGKRVTKDSIKKVEIYDVLDQTASAKLTAVWGIDYMQLAKYDGKWKIVNILWQTHPPKP